MSDITKVLSIELGCQNFFLHVEKPRGPILLYVRGRQEDHHSEHLIGVFSTRTEGVEFLDELLQQLRAIRYDLHYGGFIGDALEMVGPAPAEAERKAMMAKMEQQQEAEHGGEA